MVTRGEIIINDDAQNEGKVVKISDIPRSVMQAIYYEATQKTEKISRRFSNPYVFRFHDIENLFDFIKQTSEQYSITGNSAIVVVEHSNRDSIRYSSFEKFKEYGISNPTPIDNINIQWKFLISVPLVGLHHEYQINIVLDSFIFDDDDDDDDEFDFVYGYSGPGLKFSLTM